MVAWKVPRIWPEADVVIIGGGPSFGKIPQSKLRELSEAGFIRVIGINRAFYEIPDSGDWMDMIWFGDDSFLRTFKKKIYDFPGQRVSCAAGAKKDKAIKWLQRNKKKEPRQRHAGHGISKKPRTICWNKHSGASCINLAYHLVGPGGRVFLLGFDNCRGKNEEPYWHNGYPEKRAVRKGKNKNKPVKIPFASFAGVYPDIKRDAKRLKLKIYNVNPESELEHLPKITFETAVEMIEEKGKKNE